MAHQPAFLQRLAEERKNWRKDRPFGFVAKPSTRPDGSQDLAKWKCIIPGPADTPWEGGNYPLTLHFNPDYPTTPPVAMFPAGFFHVNVFPEGHVCLSILNGDDEMGGQWKPSISIKQILVGIQMLLTEPNLLSPAQQHAEQIYRKKPNDYHRMVQKQAKKYAQVEDDA